MDFKELTKDDEITDLIPDIENALRDTPEKTLACMGLAIHQVNLASILNGDTIESVILKRCLAFTNRSWLEFKDCRLPLRGNKFSLRTIYMNQFNLIKDTEVILPFGGIILFHMKNKTSMMLETWSKMTDLRCSFYGIRKITYFSEGPMCKVGVTVVCLYQFFSGTDDTAPESTRISAFR